jgi:predicted methyltransferase
VSQYTLHHGDCLDVLPTLPAQSVDAVICDPPYAEIDRPYGRMSEADWMAFMQAVTLEARRVLRPRGSAVFILQPNSERVGKMRLWLWRYMVWAGEEWGIVQDAYWWNTSAQPTAHTHRTAGLMRGGIKPCVWLGASDCYRDQSAVLWQESLDNAMKRAEGRMDLYRAPSGFTMRQGRQAGAALERGGVTPFNVLPIPNSVSNGITSAHGHGAATPYRLAEWWTKYLTKPGDTVMDMCMGVGTMGLAALNLGRRFVGIERDAGYFAIARERIMDAADPLRHMEAA